VREQTLQRALRDGRPMRDGNWLLTVAQPRSDVIGVLALFDPSATAGRQEQAALEHGATVLAMELARLQSVAETEVRLRRSVVDELLAGTNEPGLLGRAQALGYDLERPHRVVLVAPEGPQPDMETFFDAVRRAARDTGVGTLLSARGGTVVVLAEADRRWDDFRAAVLRELSGGRCRVGVGAVCDRPPELPRSHHEAQLALRMQDASGARDCAVVFDELGVYRILAEVDDPASVERFTRQWLTELIDYDARRRSDLVRTLSTYLECGGRYDATAAALATHRSTLKYRLQRIKEISGHDLSDADTRFNLQLATRAWYTLLALGGERT
jgi:sugar diacid utilization regulator